MKTISSPSQHKTLQKNWAREEKTYTYIGIVNIMHLEIAPETRTEGPKQSIFRTIDLEVFALRSVWNQHRCVSWRAATSFGSPSVWCWPWTTGHHSLLPGVALDSHSPSLCLLSHFCLFWSLSLWLSQHSTFILIEANSHVSYRMSKTLSRFNTQINSPHGMNEKTETQGEGGRGWLRKGRRNHSPDRSPLYNA